MTNPTNTAPGPEFPAAQHHPLRRRMIDTAAAVACAAVVALDLTDHPHLAAATRITAVGLKIIISVLDRRTDNPASRTS